MGKLSFGTTGIAYECNKVTVDSSGAPRCPRCHDRVYYNEEKKAIGKSWHKRCFICVTCRRGLDSTNCNEHDGEVFCGSCHRRQFGPRGYGFAGGAAGLSTESTVEQLRPQPGSQVLAVPQHIPASSIDPASLDCCPGCGKRVYFAEEIKALKRSWHKLCFKCKTCRKLLEPGSCSEHEGNIFCRACYSKQFGPKGYGFAGGAGSMLAAEDRYTVEARTANASRSNDGETYTLRMKRRTHSVDDKYNTDSRSVKLSQSNDDQTYTLDARRRPSAGSVLGTSDRYSTETARGVTSKMEPPAEDSRYTSRGGKGMSVEEHMYTTQQTKPSASSRLFPDDRLNPEIRLMNGSHERPTNGAYSPQGHAQPRNDSGLPTVDRYTSNTRYTNGSNGIPTEVIQTHTMPGASSGHIPEDRYNNKARYTNGQSERRASNKSYSIQARAQPSAELSSDVLYTTDYRRVNGTTERPTGQSYNPQGRPQPTGLGLVPGARRSSETRPINGVVERPAGDSYSTQTRARPSADSGLPDSYTNDSRHATGATDTYVVHARSGSGLSADARSPNARFVKGSSGPDEIHQVQTRAQFNSSTPGVIPDDRYANGAWLLDGMTEQQSVDKYASQARVMSSSGPVQFADDRYSVDSPVSSPSGRYSGQSRAAAPMTAAAVEERRYSIQARATPSAAYRSPVKNGPGKAAPVYV